MALLEFEHLSFAEADGGVKGIFHGYCEFSLTEEELGRAAPGCTVRDGALHVDGGTASAERRLTQLLDRKLRSELRHRLTGNRVVYIDEASGIPLIGSLSFGLIDRGTNCIEARPNTGCNLSCAFCSVAEGKKGAGRSCSFNVTDYLVDAEYLVSGLRELVSWKGCAVDVHIGCQGEPTLYPQLEELVGMIRALEGVRTISLVTNGVLLSPEGVRALARVGLTRLDLSLNALSPETAERLAGVPYPVKHAVEVAEAASREMELLISPVWVPGMNDAEMEPLILLAKSLKARIGIQNYLPYRFGRNPVRGMQMADFERRLRSLEKKHDVRLVLSPADFGIGPARPLKKPFRRGEAISAEIVAPGRHGGETLARASGRAITVTGCAAGESGMVRCRITREKYNVFYAAKR